MQRDQCNEAVYVYFEGRTRAVEVGRESTEELTKRLRKRWATGYGEQWYMTTTGRVIQESETAMDWVADGGTVHDSSRGGSISVSSCRGMHREPVVTRSVFCALCTESSVLPASVASWRAPRARASTFTLVGSVSNLQPGISSVLVFALVAVDTSAVL